MVRKLVLVSSCLLVLFSIAGQSRIGVAQDPQEQSRHRWLQENAHSLSLESGDFKDLEFLRALLKGKRIVQLGENTHGVREYSMLKARIVQFLHQELGFEVVAFESDIYQCWLADLSAADAPAFSKTKKSTMLGSVIGTWHTKEVLPVFEYLRSTRDGARPLRLAGFDVQPIGTNKRGRPKFLSELVKAVDSDYSTEVLSLDHRFLGAYELKSNERRAFFRSDEGVEMASSYNQLADFLNDNSVKIREASSRHVGASVLIGRQTAASMATYIRIQSATNTRASYELRDKGMAENMKCLLDEIYPDKKVIVWGHNFHIRHNNKAIPANKDSSPDVAVRSMGSWVHDRYRDEVYTLGLYAYSGEAAGNNGKVFEIKPAKPDSLEGIMHSVGDQVSFVDMSQVPEKPVTSWMHQPISARHNGTHELKMILKDQYDAILFFDKVTPRQMLY